jgi:ClpX C4-type zinc finger
MFLRSTLRCSFCRKKDTEVAKLVAGPRVYICDECVAIAKRLMEDADNVQISPPRVEPAWWRRIWSRFLGLPGRTSKYVVPA